MSGKIVYKYDKEKRIQSHIVYNINWGCKYKYISDFRKTYYYHKVTNTIQIIKERNVNNKFELISSIVDFKGSKFYSSYKDGKVIYTKFLNKNKTVFETNVLINIGDSSIEEMKFTNKKGEVEKHLQIKTKNGTNR